MELAGKKVIITAGPTWVAIDRVRVISNISSGETGILLAQEASRRGAKVTLVLGPVGRVAVDKEIRLIRFSYFDELMSLLKKLLARQRFDIAIHAAAISDYEPLRLRSGKISSHKETLHLDLRRTPKLVSLFKMLQPAIHLTMFKLETADSAAIVRKTRQVMLAAKADFAVLNALEPYRARIITQEKHLYRVVSKKQLARQLLNTIERYTCR